MLIPGFTAEFIALYFNARLHETLPPSLRKKRERVETPIKNDLFTEFQWAFVVPDSELNRGFSWFRDAHFEPGVDHFTKDLDKFATIEHPGKTLIFRSLPLIPRGMGANSYVGYAGDLSLRAVMMYDALAGGMNTRVSMLVAPVQL